MKLSSSLCLTSVLAGSGSRPLHRSAEPRPFYAGKTINMIVGCRPAAARMPMPGCLHVIFRDTFRHAQYRSAESARRGSLKSVVYLNTTAPSDGTQIGTFSSTLLMSR